MLILFQLFLAVSAIYSAASLEGMTRLFLLLVCLILMFIVGRLDRRRSEKGKARKEFLKSEIDKISQKDSTLIKDQDFFTIETLLWPKNELLLLDTVHAILKDMGFQISAGIRYQSVDRIVRIPETDKAFGIQVMMCGREADRKHPKISRILRFEKEKKENEKSLVIASTHVRLSLSDRGQVSHISRELTDLFVQNNIGFITAHHLYGLWQKMKRGEIDIFEFFKEIYSRKGGLSPQKGMGEIRSPLPELPIQ